MTKAITPLELAIEHKADNVRLLATPEQGIELGRLRDETAALQSLIAEASRLQLLERPFHVNGLALFVPIVVKAEEFVGYCLVTNLSPDGMMAKVYATISRQQPICVHFASHQQIRGTLVWSGANRIGVRFHARIDVAKVLSSLGSEHASIGPNRPPRLEFRCLAEISVGERCQFSEVANVSQRGIKILSKLGTPGKKVTVQLHELDEREATVRWSGSGSAGLAFAKPLSFTELAHFAPASAVNF